MRRKRTSIKVLLQVAHNHNHHVLSTLPSTILRNREGIAARRLPVQIRNFPSQDLKVLVPTTFHSAAGMLVVPLQDARGNLSLSFLPTLVFSYRGQNKIALSSQYSVSPNLKQINYIQM